MMDSRNFKHLTIEEKNKAFIHAAVAGDIDMIKTLIEIGKINLNYQDNLGRTALMWAVKYKRTEIISILVNAGADANIADYTGQTPSMLINMNSDENKENNHFIDHHYNSLVTFSEHASPHSKNLKFTHDIKPNNQLIQAENNLKQSNQNCLVM